MRRSARCVEHAAEAIRRTSPRAVSNATLTRKRAGPTSNRGGPGAANAGLSGFQPPAFNAIAATLSFGAPTDISMGWDGTLWAIDDSGAPHLYDPIAQQWQPYGGGVDAVASIGPAWYFFRGSEYITVLNQHDAQGSPVAIATTWPTLPDSFKLGVQGAANVGNKLYFFRGGWYVPVDSSAAPAKLTDLKNWPQTANWIDGVIDTAGNDAAGNVRIYHGTEFIVVDLQARQVVGRPSAFGADPDWQDRIPAEWASSGIDAMIGYGGADKSYMICKGSAVACFKGSDPRAPTPLQYIGGAFTGWPATWNPVLAQAPSGRVGNLWSVIETGNILQHDGDRWIEQADLADYVAVGVDGTVMMANIGTLSRWNGAGWNQLARLQGLSQIAVGDANTVWVRDVSHNVYQFDATAGSFSPAPLVGTATHIAANPDGTLWHCKGNANTYRLVSEWNKPSATLSVADAKVSAVQKVASSGFGTAHCLTRQTDGSTALYRYESPYVFKTSKRYSVGARQTIERGVGNLYLIEIENAGHSPPMPLPQSYVVALDAHTGRELARVLAIPSGWGDASEAGIVFDPVNELVYATTVPPPLRENACGRLLALDARTLAVKWSFDTAAAMDGAPALNGTQLCFGDRSGKIYMFDTRAALANAPSPQPQWTVPIDIDEDSYYRVLTPVLSGGQMYAVVWAFADRDGPSTATLNVVQCNAVDSNNLVVSYKLNQTTSTADPVTVMNPPVLGVVNDAGGKPQRGLYISGGDCVYGFPFGDTSPACFTLPTGVVTSGFAWDDGTRGGVGLAGANAPAPTVWFGDNYGNLWALGANMQPAYGTPFAIKGAVILTTPVLYKDPNGGMTVLFGSANPQDPAPALWGFDADSGNAATVPTAATTLTALSTSAPHGVIYAAGSMGNVDAEKLSPPQLFAIRVDDLPQALRAFVIESQLMQDPDPNAKGGSTDADNPIPPSVARYQTHLTVVDDQKSPLPHEPVKIWADKTVTITVDGQQFTAGPGDNDYAAVKTGADGSLVIVSDASDMFASALRVWTSFMDSCERIVVNPDQEFHTRVTTAHANATDDDPQKVNLVAAHNYNAVPLFTDDEKSQQQPQNCANAIAQMNKGVGLDGGGSKASYTNLLRLARGDQPRAGGPLPPAAAAPENYLAYADLRGASHYPTNIPALRPVTIVSPVGLVYARPQDHKDSVPAFAAVHHSDALRQIDQLTGKPWNAPNDSSNPALGARRLGSWSDFWNWLRRVVDGIVNFITHVIVAVAEEVVVGIRMMINGLETVFKAIITVVEDIAAAVGSFFRMLAKAIEDLVAALSVLFHFGEIMKTQRWMAAQINANIGQIADAMTTHVKAPMDTFFNQGDHAVQQLFDSIRKKLGLSDSSRISDLQGGQSTAHTAFSAASGAVGPGSGGRSHAVQCTHTTQKMKTGLLAAQPIPGTATRRLGVADDHQALSRFVNDFVEGLENNQNLKSAFAEVSASIKDLGQRQSAQDFFKSVLNVLLSIIEALIIGAIAVTQALLDGLIDAMSALIDTVQKLLNTPIEIPFLTWLYQLLFKEPLTILNAVTLAAAIPVTIIYRVVEGHYPSVDGITGAVGGRVSAAPAVTPDVIKKMQGFIGGCTAFGLGIVRAVVDAAGADPPRIATVLVLTYALSYVATYFPLMLPGATPSTYQWIGWGLGVALAALGFFAVIELEDKENQTIMRGLLIIVRIVLAIPRAVVYTLDFTEAGNTKVTTDLAFARNLFLELPPLMNWLKAFQAAPANVALAVVDVVTGVGVCALDIALLYVKPQALDGAQPRQA